MGDITPHFSRREFRCPHGPRDTSWEWNFIGRLARNLEVLRASIDQPIYVLSGYRCPECNAKCKGARKSYHLTGRAADIWAEGWEPEDLARRIVALIKEKRMAPGGVGIYFSGRGSRNRPFVHYDIRGQLVRWQCRRT